VRGSPKYRTPTRLDISFSGRLNFFPVSNVAANKVVVGAKQFAVNAGMIELVVASNILKAERRAAAHDIIEPIVELCVVIVEHFGFTVGNQFVAVRIYLRSAFDDVFNEMTNTSERPLSR